MPSSPLKKGTGSERYLLGARPSAPQRGACPLFQRTGSGILALTGVLLAVTGCVPPPAVPPATRREAIERVNNNLTQIRQPLQYGGWVSFKFRDEAGKLHSFDLNEARLIYSPPQSLLFDVRSSLAGPVAQFGSNDEQYWLWIDVPDFRKLWLGGWQNVSPSSERKLPVPPNELFDALMLRPLPESLEGGQLPLLRIQGEDYRLWFIRLGPGGQPVGWREILLAPRPPYQPLEVIDRLPDGEVLMDAQLTDYTRIGADGPFTARRYVVQWPQHEAEMRLDLNGAKFRPDLPADIFASPTGWRGELEQIDAAPDSAGGP